MLEQRGRLARDLVTHSSAACDWCASPFYPVYRAKLCRHCYRIECDRRGLSTKIKQTKATNWRSVPFELRFAYRVAVMMEDMAKGESLLFGETDPVHSGMTLEKLMNYISSKLIHRSLYSNYASLFSDLFSPDQRQALIHLLSRTIRDHMRRRRRQMATSRVITKGLASVPLGARSKEW
jgi:hypothetical protein